MDVSLRAPFWHVDAGPTDQAATAPDITALRGPVFLQDAVTPWGGETLLLAILRAQAAQDIED